MTEPGHIDRRIFTWLPMWVNIVFIAFGLFCAGYVLVQAWPFD